MIGGKIFDKVTTIGFSLGSVSLVSLAKQYPADADTLILHGFSWNAATLYQGFFAGLQEAAAPVNPQRWGYLPNTYTTQSTPASREATVIYGNFDPGIVPLDFELRDIDTIGASITIPSHSLYIGKYPGPLFLGNSSGKLPVQSLDFEMNKELPIESFHSMQRFTDNIVKLIHMKCTAISRMQPPGR